MKRLELVRKLTELGCELIRHGGNHDWYQNKQSKACQPVPRHREINENLAKSILKKLSAS
jgi:predicted RNA binding protein YcfA (HicA-like mRNA interferase family)